MEGYTLSHLRRVPELTLSAKKVMQGVAKQCQREERKKEKEKPKASQKSPAAPSSSSMSISKTFASTRTVSKDGDRDWLGPKMKRLFRFAIRELYQVGSIVLWDGPVRSLPRPYEHPGCHHIVVVSPGLSVHLRIDFGSRTPPYLPPVGTPQFYLLQPPFKKKRTMRASLATPRTTRKPISRLPLCTSAELSNGTSRRLPLPVRLRGLWFWLDRKVRNRVLRRVSSWCICNGKTRSGLESVNGLSRKHWISGSQRVRSGVLGIIGGKSVAE